MKPKMVEYKMYIWDYLSDIGLWSVMILCYILKPYMDIDIDSSKKAARFLTTGDISAVRFLKWRARLGVAHLRNSDFAALSISWLLVIHLQIASMQRRILSFRTTHSPARHNGRPNYHLRMSDGCVPTNGWDPDVCCVQYEEQRPKDGSLGNAAIHLPRRCGFTVHMDWQRKTL